MRSDKGIAKCAHMCRLFYRSLKILFIKNNDISTETFTHPNTVLLLPIQSSFPRIAIVGFKISQGNQFFLTLGEGSFVSIFPL